MACSCENAFKISHDVFKQLVLKQFYFSSVAFQMDFCACLLIGACMLIGACLQVV